MTKANDKQIGGSHYRKHGIYQPWDVLTAWLTPEEYRGWQKGTAIVYLARERDKNGDQDIEKAGHHIHKLVEVLQAQREQTTIGTLNDIAKTADAAGQIIGALGDTLKDIHGRVMGREEAFAHAMDACDRAEERAADATSLIGIPAREDKLRWERVNSDKRNEELDTYLAGMQADIFKGLGIDPALLRAAGERFPTAEKIVRGEASPNAYDVLAEMTAAAFKPTRAPFVKALWEGFTERHAAQFKALGITAEHLARAGAELTRHLEQPRADHIDPLKP